MGTGGLGLLHSLAAPARLAALPALASLTAFPALPRSSPGIVSRVGPHVPGDHVPATGGIRALRTLVGLLAGVGPLVGGQVIRAREHLAADSNAFLQCGKPISLCSESSLIISTLLKMLRDQIVGGSDRLYI